MTLSLAFPGSSLDDQLEIFDGRGLGQQGHDVPDGLAVVGALGAGAESVVFTLPQRDGQTLAGAAVHQHQVTLEAGLLLRRWQGAFPRDADGLLNAVGRKLGGCDPGIHGFFSLSGIQSDVPASHATITLEAVPPALKPLFIFFAINAE